MKNKIFVLMLVFGLLFITGCKEKTNDNNNDDDKQTNNPTELEMPIIEMDKEYYNVGDKIGFKLENYDSLDLFNITFDDQYAVKFNDDGTITARRNGEYTVTLSLKEDTSKNIALDFKVYKSSFALDSTTTIIAVGDKVEVWVYDFSGLYETKNEDFNYTVDNTDIATIENGVLTALGIGTVTVTATSKYNPLVKSNLSIRVGDPTSEFMIRPTIELGKIQVGEILPVVMTMNQLPENFKWLCDNSEIVRTTSYEGKLEFTGIGEGQAFITCYNEEDPTIKAKYLITVSGTADVDFRARFVNLAYSQVGIYEGKDSDGSYNNFQKFGAWYGNDGAPWCATFVSWCWYHAGLSNELLLKYQGCYTGMEWCLEKGIFKYKEDYTPQTGDVVFFLSNGASHTGIVAYCDGTYIYTVEGNRSNRVDVWRIKVTNSTITGYAVPNYPESTYREDLSWFKDKQINGKYLWTDVTSGDSTV